MIPEYRVWAGATLWLGATVVDFFWFSLAYPSWAGFLSLVGFWVAVMWSLYGPARSS